MLEYFDKLSSELKERRITLITNIRAGSSSFFAAYRSLCEEFTRHALNAGGYEIGKGAKISIVLSRTEVREYFSDLGTNEESVEKIKNYILKINKQLHEKEKPFDTELTVKYVSALYRFTAPFANAAGIMTEAPSDDDIRAICKTHGDIESARAEVMRRSEEMFSEIKDTIADRFNIIDGTMQKMQSSLNTLNEFVEREEAERQKREREEQINRKIEEDIRLREEKQRKAEAAARLRAAKQKEKEENERLKLYRTNNIIQTAPQYYAYVKGVLEYKAAKILLIALSVLSLLIPLIYYTVLSSLIGYLPAFFFGTIFWEVMTVILTVKTIMTKEIYPVTKAIDIFPTDIVSIPLGAHIPDELNAKYKVAAIIAGVSLVFDAVLISSTVKSPMNYSHELDVTVHVTMILFILLTVTLMISTCMMAAHYFTNYAIVIYRGRIGSDDTYVEQNVINAAGMLIDEETFVEKWRDGRPIVYPDNPVK